MAVGNDAHDGCNAKGPSEADPEVEAAARPHPLASHAAVDHSSRTDGSFFSTIRCLVWTVFVPTCFLAFGNSLPYPTLPVYALALSLNGLALGVSIAGISLGRLSTNPLSSAVLSTIGVRRTMVLSFLVSSVAAVITATSIGFWSLFIGLLLQGFGASLEALGRMTYSKMAVPNQHRGRSVAILGGTVRLGSVIGPALGGLSASRYGLKTPFSLQIPVYCAGALVCFLGFPAEERTRPLPDTPGSNVSKTTIAASPAYVEVIQAHWRNLLYAGTSMFVLQFLRSSRVILIPLFGHSLGLRADQIGFVLTISFMVDVCFFPLAGVISDKYGRKRCGLPAFIVLTASMFVLRGSTLFSHLMMSGIMAGAGNGLSSGLVMTTGTDLAPPPPATSLFLGLYAIFYDGGESLAPVLVGLVSMATNLHVAGLVVSVIGLLGTTWYAFLVPETLLSRRPTIKRSRPRGTKKPFDAVPTDSIPIPMAVGSIPEIGESQHGN